MQIIDIFISNSNGFDEKILKKQISKVHLSNNIEIFEMEVNRFKVFITYLGKKEELIDFGKDLKFIVGNIISFDSLRQKTDTMQSGFQKFKKKNNDNLALFRDILGSSALFDISKNKIVIKTDLISTIPVYYLNNFDGCISFSTHIDFFRSVDPNVMLDPVSAVEFLALGTVTFPHTIYQDIKQLPPASVFEYNDTNQTCAYHHYWLPGNSKKYENIETAASVVNQTLHKLVSIAMEGGDEKRLLMSGGEDSRLLACLMKNYGEFEGDIILANKNREYRYAKGASDKIGFKLNFVHRQKDYYATVIQKAMCLCGKGQQYMHMHALQDELIQKISFNKSVLVASGYLSDAVLKGSRIKKSNALLRLGIELKAKKFTTDILTPKDASIFKSNLVKEVNKRRSDLRSENYYQGLARDSEIFGYAPITHYKSNAFSTGHRRVYNLFEPFMSNEMIYISAKIPASYKLNRRVFQKIYHRNCSATGNLGHTSGHIPNKKFMTNLVVRWIVLLYRKLFDEKYGQGPWDDYRDLMNRLETRELVNTKSESLVDVVSSVSKKTFLSDNLFKGSNITSLIQLCLMMVNEKN